MGYNTALARLKLALIPGLHCVRGGDGGGAPASKTTKQGKLL
jgi:hypothetical protein